MANMVSTVWLVCVLSVMGLCAGQLCKDIDATACKLMSASRPDLCADPSLSKTACPRFCNLCPVECYNCNTTLTDYNDCNTTQLCQQGEVCMRKELTSFVDGHREYELTCEKKEFCDGTGAVFHFGKRDVESRDVSLHCCTDDLCNMPNTVKLTNCDKDIVLMVDRSIGSVLAGDSTNIVTFLFHLVSKLNIGPTENLVAMTEYDSHAHAVWDLNTHTDKYDLERAIQGLNTHNSPNHFQVADTDEAVKFIVDHAMSPATGDRADHADAVVILATSDTAHRINVNIRNAQELRRQSNDVIVISVGAGSTTSSGLDGLATDSSHMFHVSNYSGLDDSLLANVLQMLKAC